MTILPQRRWSSFLLLVLLGFGFGAAPAHADQAARSKFSITEYRGSEAAAPKVAESEDDKYRMSPIVQSFGHALGLEPEQAATVFEFVNFGLLAAGVGFLLLRTLPKTFRNRSNVIQKDLTDARAATEEASTRLNSVEERLTKLDAQIAEMRAQAERDSVTDEARIRTSIDEERKRILAAAEQEITSASTQAQRRLQQYAAELAIEQAARKLVVTAETDRLIVQGFARRLGVEGPKGGEN